jgi:hypothetical protein
VILAGLALLGCSGGDDLDCTMIKAMDALPATAALVSLPGPQRSQLCDSTACDNGGYGVQHSCPNGPSVTFAGDRGQCLRQWPTNPQCQATVQDLMGCMKAIKASPCVSTLLGSAACDALSDFECATFTPTGASLGMAAIAGTRP